MFDPLRIDLLPDHGRLRIQVNAWRGPCIAVMYGDQEMPVDRHEVSDSPWPYYVQRSWFFGSPNTLTVVSGELQCVVECSARPKVLQGELDVQLHWNGIPMEDIEREELLNSRGQTVPLA